MWEQYTILNRHGGTSKCVLLILLVQPHMFQGVQLVQFYIKTTLICLIRQIIGGRGVTRRAYLGLSLLWYNILPLSQGTVGAIYVQTQQKQSLNVCIYCSMLSSKIILGGTSFYMKPMPVIFLFSTDCDPLSNTYNFDWNPCLVIK